MDEDVDDDDDDDKFYIVLYSICVLPYDFFGNQTAVPL